VNGKPLLRSPSRQVQPAGAWLRAASARARRSARIGWARQYDSIASRGVGGTNGWARARDSTARGNTGGKALVSRASDRRFLSAFSSCQPDIVWPQPVGASCDKSCEGFVACRESSQAGMLANYHQSSLRQSLSRCGTRIISPCLLDLAGRSTEKTQAQRNRVCRCAMLAYCFRGRQSKHSCGV
jgi:hypothetical protein